MKHTYQHAKGNTKSKAICGKKISEFVFSAVSFTANVAMGNVSSDALDAASAIVDLATIPICPADKSGKLPVILKELKNPLKKTF